MGQVKTTSNYNGALQQPIGSGFNASSTTNDVIKGIDLTGKTAIVTGGYAGLGLETTRIFSEVGAKVIVPVRDLEKAKKNLNGMTNVALEVMDLMNPESIDSFAENFLSKYDTLHILVNNAGIMWVPLRRDKSGNESHLSTNHLGHFRLTAKLWPALKNANGARVVNVSSWGHHFSDFNFEDYNFLNREYDQSAAYGQSKTANNLFTVELDAKGQKHGVRSYSLHPGSIVDTDLKRESSKEQLLASGVYDEHGQPIRDASRGLKTIPQGASTQVWCATSPQLQNIGGVYCEDNDVSVLDTESSGHQLEDVFKFHGVMGYSVDKERAEKLWKLSEEITGVKFDIQ